MSTLLVDNIAPFSSGSTSINVTASYALTSSYAMNGGGGGSTLTIPKPIIYASQANNFYHTYNEPISGVGTGTGSPGARSNSWSIEMLKLTYQTNDLSFLNYNPKYFLFVYNRSKRYGKFSISSYPNTRINNEKYGKYFSHPASYTGSYIDLGGGNYSSSFTPTATYTNFSKGSVVEYFLNGTVPKYHPDFTSFTTEWNVNTNTGQPTTLNGFNPLRWYRNNVTNVSGSLYANEFFPWNINAYAVDDILVHTQKGHTIPGGNTINNPKRPRINLYVKFAIVIQNPLNISNYIIGPMSDTVVIYPKAGYFDNNTITPQKYYYAWATQFA